MTTTTVARPRRPVIAALMSAVLPGFGQLYNGELNRGLWLFLIFVGITVPFVAFVSLWLPVSWTALLILLGLVLAIAVWLYAIMDAWRVARRQVLHQQSEWQTVGVYVAVFVACNMVLLPSILMFVRENVVQSFFIPTNSMSPTLERGDILFADMRYNRPNSGKAVRRGDVAIFVYPNNRNLYYVKRVVALPGDVVEQVDGEWEVRAAPDLVRDAVPELLVLDPQSAGQRVPPGHAFVLGDNVDFSRDSRHFGMVPLSDIVGRPRQIWFSRGADGIRWGRLGRALQSD